MKYTCLFLSVFLMVSLVATSGWVQIPRVKAQELGGNFGNPVIPEMLNWTRFWKLFNQYSAWDLEYNNGSGWISDKSQLKVMKNYSKPGYEDRIYNLNKSDASACKITLNFTAKYDADYRLTFGINLDVKNYTHKEGAWNYTLTYQNHTVYFDWSDIKDLPLDNISHGIKEVNGENWFWFRIRKNSVPQGKNVVIDPSFGYTTEGAFETACGNYQSYQNFTFTESQSGPYTADSISVFYDVNEINNNCSFALYNNSWNLIQYCEEHVNATVQNDYWITLDFITPKPELTNNTNYILSWWQSDENGGINSFDFHRDVGGSHAYFNNPYDYPTWDDPASHTDPNFVASIYCNYTLGVQEYSEEFSENIGVSASLSRWREKTFFYTETIVITESSSFTKELLFDVIEFTELIQFDADLYLILPTIPVEDEVSTFGTMGFVIAIIALAIGIVAFTRRS